VFVGAKRNIGVSGSKTDGSVSENKVVEHETDGQYDTKEWDRTGGPLDRLPFSSSRFSLVLSSKYR
jgi:hypothetical protein